MQLKDCYCVCAVPVQNLIKISVHPASDSPHKTSSTSVKREQNIQRPTYQYDQEPEFPDESVTCSAAEQMYNRWMAEHLAISRLC